MDAGILSDEKRTEPKKNIWKELSVQKGRWHIEVLLEALFMNKIFILLELQKANFFPWLSYIKRADMKHRISNMNSECLTHHRKNCPAHFFSLCAPARSPIRCDSLHNKENGVVRCTAIINNLFSVEVHIGADACWVVSFGKMALICSGPHTASAPPKDASSKALWSNVVCITPWTLNSQVWKIPVNVIVLWSHYYNLINHISIKKMLRHQVFALVFKCIA